MTRAEILQSGFFVMADATAILKFQNDLDSAKTYLQDKVNTFKNAHPDVKPESVAKVENMISGSLSVRSLSMAVANFVLAHISLDLKVLR